jgi:putative SOS response-associated peptidase YedK
MCGRYMLVTAVGRLAEEFRLNDAAVDLTPSYNVTPVRQVAAVLAQDGKGRLERLWWGLVPS